MSKIQTAVAELGLEDVLEQLHDRRRDGESLRDLRDYYNEQVIEATLNAAGGSVLTDTDRIQRALTGTLDSAGKQIEIEHTLTEKGVDVDELESRLISHETLRKYLNEQDVTPETTTDPVTKTEVRETVDWAKSREEAIIRRKLEQLADADAVEFDAIEIDTSVIITCADSGVSYPLEEFIDRGGC